MRATHEKKLANSLELLNAAQQDGVVRSTDITRTHRERLIKNGFLMEATKGWLMVTSPSVADGASTSWYAGFWAFVARYLGERFGTAYCLFPEASIRRHVMSGTVPRQIIVVTTIGGHQLLKLPFDTSLLIYPDKANFPADRVQENGLWIMALPAALCRVQPSFFPGNAHDAELGLRMVRDPGQLLRRLLEDGSSAVAGRLAGANQFLGDIHTARQIREAMTAAAHDVRISNPFQSDLPILGGRARITSPQAARIRLMWAAMRPAVVDVFQKAPGFPTCSCLLRQGH